MIGAVIAMEEEAEALLSQTEIKAKFGLFGKPCYQGRAFGEEVILTVCGVGKVNAAAGTCAVLSRGADRVLNFGVAGGLHGGTAIAEVYLIEKAVQYDFDITQLEGGLIGTLDGEKENFLPLLAPAALPFPRRALGTGDRFNDSPQDHALLLKLGADIRDMEGAAIAQAAKNAGVPLLSVKSISDIYGAGSTTEQFEKNTTRAMLSLKAHLKDIIAALANA